MVHQCGIRVELKLNALQVIKRAPLQQETSLNWLYHMSQRARPKQVVNIQQEQTHHPQLMQQTRSMCHTKKIRPYANGNACNDCPTPHARFRVPM